MTHHDGGRRLASLSDDAPEFVGGLPPGSRQRRSGKWTERTKLLRQRPGEWARWKENGRAATSGTLKRAERLGDFGPGGFEFTNRTVDGVTYIYARFLGEADPGAPM